MYNYFLDVVVSWKACISFLKIKSNNLYNPGYRSIYETMLLENGKKAGYSQVYDDLDALIDAASNSKFYWDVKIPFDQNIFDMIKFSNARNLWKIA